MAQLAVTVALTALQMALTASRKIEGPRLEDLKFTTADPGTPRNYLYGMRRVTVPVIWKTNLIEEKRRRKTKGGKFSDYTYYANFMVEVCDHSLDAVAKVYADKHLILDRTGTGPVSPFAVGKRYDVTKNIRPYLGSETQLPDPLVLAETEARMGVGSCPGYRGKSLVVFERLPVEKFGNRVPQIDVIAVRNGATIYPVESVARVDTGPNDLAAWAWSPDYSRFMFATGNGTEIWDTAARSLMLKPTAALTGAVTGLSNNGTIYSVRDTLLDPHVTIFAPDGMSSAAADIALAQRCQFAQVLADGEGNEYCCIAPFGNQENWLQYFQIGGQATPVPIVINPGFSTSHYLNDDAGNIWAAGGPHGSSDQVHFLCIAGNRNGESHSLTAPTSHAGKPNVRAVHNGNGSFVVNHANQLFLVDDQTFAVGTTVAHTTSDADLPRFIFCPPGSASIWLENKEVSLATLATIRTPAYSLWGTTSIGARIIYDPVNHALIQFYSDSTIKWLYLDRIGSSGTQLRTIVDGVAAMQGMDAANYDFAALTPTILGFNFTQGPGKDIVEPLLDLHDCDIRPHGFVLEGKLRGGASGGTLVSTSFVREADEPAPYASPGGGGTDLPLALELKFADSTADQQPDTARAFRSAESVDSDRILTIDMSTTVMTPDDAKQKADRLLRRMWISAKSYELGVSGRQIQLEPADAMVLNLDGQVKAARLTRMVIEGGGTIRTDWLRDDSAIATLNGQTGATLDGRPDQVMFTPGIAKGIVLDMPLRQDADNSVNPKLYAAAGPYAPGTLPGVIFYESLDGGATYEDEVAAVTAAETMSWGMATNVLATANPWLWDRGGSVTIVMRNGELTGATEAQCDANPRLNQVAFGAPGRWEILQFTTAPLIAANTYTVSGLKRGRRGTEWAVGSHAAGDAFVLLDDAVDFEMDVGDINDALLFKAVTVGRDAESAFPIALTYGAHSHKPWAPAQLTATKDPVSGDWVFTWRRRCRIAGDGVPTLDTVPLGDAAENYKVFIYNGAVVVRTITVTAETATWTAAQQTTDFGSGQATVKVGVLQVGDLVDGYETIATFP